LEVFFSDLCKDCALQHNAVYGVNLLPGQAANGDVSSQNFDFAFFENMRLFHKKKKQSFEKFEFFSSSNTFALYHKTVRTELQRK